MNKAYQWFEDNKMNVFNAVNIDFYRPVWIDDWSQDLALHLFRKGDQLKDDRKTKEFVYTVAYNLAKNYFKRQDKVLKSAGNSDNYIITHNANPEKIMLQREALNQVNKALGVLPPARRKVINIFMAEEGKLTDMAINNKMNKESFKTHYRLARIELKDFVSYEHVDMGGTTTIEVLNEEDETTISGTFR